MGYICCCAHKSNKQTDSDKGHQKTKNESCRATWSRGGRWVADHMGARKREPAISPPCFTNPQRPPSLGHVTHLYDGNAEHAIRRMSPNTPLADRSTPPAEN